MKNDKLIFGLLGLVILVVVVFSLIGNTTSDISAGADSIYYASNCTEGKDNASLTLTYNITDGNCYGWNDTAQNMRHIYYDATEYNLPLKGLFSSTGVVVLVLMAGLMIFLISVVLRKPKLK